MNLGSTSAKLAHSAFATVLRLLGWLLLGLPGGGHLTADATSSARLATRFGGWWERRPRLLHAFVVLALCWTVAYLTWRIAFSTKGTEPVLWSALLVAELYGIWSLATLAWMAWDLAPPDRRRSPWVRRRRAVAAVPAGELPATGELAIDVYVCTYDEPLQVLEATLAGCSLLSEPRTTYVLDDGRREEVRELARVWSARYIARPDNANAKAGNINHALTLTGGDLVLVLDADHVPLPDALQTLRRAFDDPRLALVQSPHDFSNHDSVQHYGIGRHEQSLFFDVICPGKDRHGAAYWCGSGALIRRAALLQVGGVATDTIAEDFHTTIKLHRAGWRTRYEQRTVLQGRAPHDLASYLLQRDRWARGNLTVLRTPESPLRARGLTPAQRLSYLASLTGYLAGPMRLLLIATLTVVLWTGALPLRLAPLAIVTLWAPATLLSILAGTALCRGRQSTAECSHYELCTAEIFTKALRCVVRPGRARFKVTPKEGVDHGGWEAVRQFKLMLILAALLFIGLLGRVATDLGAGVLPPMHGFAIWFVPLLGAIEMRRMLRTFLLVARRRQLRVGYRTPLEVSALVTPHREAGVDVARNGHVPAEETASPPVITADRARESEGARAAATPLVARVCDITAAGVGFELARPLEEGRAATLSLQLPAVGERRAEQIRIEAQVCSCQPNGTVWRIGATISSVNEQHRRWLVEYCHVIWPYLRLRGRLPESSGAPRRERVVDTATAG